MNQFPSFRVVSALLACCALGITARAHTPADEMTEAASRLLAALSPEQKAQCTFSLNDQERENFHFVPKPRRGVSLKELTPAQRHLAHGLLASGLSHRGYLKATTIMSLEEVLQELEKGRGPVRDPELYFVSIFGQPGTNNAWGWRVEGHHLSLNFTVAAETGISVTPSFFGSNPAEVRTGPRQGLRVLAAEEDLARQLVQALNEGQRKSAVYDRQAPSDIITAADRKARLLTPAGLSAATMTQPQVTLLWSLVEQYVFRYRPEVAKDDLAKIKGVGLDKIFFAWAGPLEPGNGHYYRLQGPTFLMEYDNTQNNANHVHTVWRDLENDFGEDLLRKHYDRDHR